MEEELLSEPFEFECLSLNEPEGEELADGGLTARGAGVDEVKPGASLAVAVIAFAAARAFSPDKEEDRLGL